MKNIQYLILSFIIILLFALAGYSLDSERLLTDNNITNKAILLWLEDWELPEQNYSRWKLLGEEKIGYSPSWSNCTKSGYSSDYSISSNYSHRSEIFCQSDNSHRGYGVVSFHGDHTVPNDDIKNNFNGIDALYGVVNTYWSWLDVPYTFGNKKWFSFLTISTSVDNSCSDQNWSVITLGLEDSSRKLTPAHIINRGGTVEYEKNIPQFPLKKWVRTTVYINYYEGQMHVWQDGKHILKATFHRKNKDICHFHWGSYASGNNDNIVLYEDDLSIWKLQDEWKNFDIEPWFKV